MVLKDLPDRLALTERMELTGPMVPKDLPVL